MGAGPSTHTTQASTQPQQVPQTPQVATENTSLDAAGQQGGQVPPPTPSVESQQQYIPNTNVRMPFSRSLYQIARNSPWQAVSSVAALFVILAMCVTLPLVFPLNSTN